jgi:nicotinamidase-related amidase
VSAVAAVGSLAVPASTPYPWPYDGGVPAGSLALVLAGWDQHWASRASGQEAATRAAALAAAIAAWGGRVLAVAHTRPMRAPRDAPLPEPLPLPVAGATRVASAGIDGFTGSALDQLLRGHGTTHLLLAGHGLEGPVHSTLRSANDRGYECLLVADAASPLDPRLVDASVSTVNMSGGIFGAVGASVDVLAALAALDPHRSEER